MTTTLRRPRPLSVTIRDVEPTTYERCGLLRDWLRDLGVERVTVLLARGARPTGELADWLRLCRAGGDQVVAERRAHRRGSSRRRLRADGTLCLEVDPADLDRPRRVLALERVIRRACRAA